MAKGKIKRVANLDRKFGASDEYLFLKVQSDFSSSAEEYLLLTDSEFVEAAHRADTNPEDCEGLRRGILTVRDNSERRFGSSTSYFATLVQNELGEDCPLLLTAFELERIRQRVDENSEDIEANKTGWLADLFD